MLISKNEKERFFKFALVGLSGTIIDFSIFNLLLHIPLGSIYASIISFTIAVINNFYWNRNWTYPESKIHSITTQLIKFSVVSLAGLIIRTTLYKITEPHSINFAKQILSENIYLSADGIGKNITLAIVIVFVLFWNFLVNRFWTYKNIN